MYAPNFELARPDELPAALVSHVREQLNQIASSFENWPLKKRCFAILELVRTLVAIDLIELHRRPSIPLLYTSGVRYRPQLTQGGQYSGIETWSDVLTCLSRGEGSCEDLAAWRIAERRIRGLEAKPFVHSRFTPELTTYHVVVRYSGVEEDPSKRLGMGAHF